MLGSLWSTTNAPDYHMLANDASSQWGLRLRAFLMLFSNRIWRGGPRIGLQIFACALSFMLLYHMVPLSLEGKYQSLFSWSNDVPGITGDLRIVVFGSQDMMGSAIDAQRSKLTWPEHLCSQLNCSSLVSLVPSIETKPGILSNGLYGNEVHSLQQLNEKADIIARPASDNFYIPEQYPVPTETPDLEAQIKTFLSMAAPEAAPRQTLWVFSFGTWDVWNMAALPRKSGENLIDKLIDLLFSQIELLYRKSLNPKSIAFSDFWSNATKTDIARLTRPDAAKRIDERKLESFRVLIPELFDITLAPGWQKRPLPPMPHSRAVQLRNAAYLADLWNSKISSQLKDWKKKAGSKPMGMEDEGVEVAVEIPSSNSLLQYLPAALRSGKGHKNKRDGKEDTIYAPFPRRLGLQSSLAVKVLDAMTEEEMQRSGLKDSKGRGTMPVTGAMRFIDVWTPCVAGQRTVVGVEMNHSSEECDTANDHLFYDSFTLAERATQGLVKEVADGVWNKLFARM